MKRIAIAGFQHETNCFGTAKATYADFGMDDSWPGLMSGQAVIERTKGLNLAVTGFLDAMPQDWEPVPLIWCSAEPSAHVTDDAFERICGLIIAGLEKAGLEKKGPVDGLFLDLHGAMVTETYPDGEGELLRRIRDVTGPDLPLVVALDLHANVSARMVGHADYISIFRTYPHLDMNTTGARCVPALRRLLNGGKFHKAFRQVPYLLPLHAQCTDVEPARDLYDKLDHLPPGCLADIALGFTAADYPDTGPSVLAYAPDQGAARDDADQTADALLAYMLEIESAFDKTMLTPAEAIALAVSQAEDTPGKPLVFADVQDNPGAGGTSDTVGILKALAEHKMQGVMLALLHDPETAALAHATGEGGTFEAAIGGKSGLPGQHPFKTRVRVIKTDAGFCAYTGEMMGEGVAALGKSAVLKLEDPETDIRLVVTTIRNQCLDLAHFTHFGLDPAQARILVVKSTVHYRAAFAPLASACLSVRSPGAFPCDLSQTPYRRLRPDMRV